MNSVFIKSSIRQAVPSRYSSGLVLGPIRDKTRCGFSHTLDRLPCRPRRPSAVVESFATLALAAYMADKCYERSTAGDSWTRELVLNVPIDVELSPAISILTDGIRFLTGDFWRIKARAEQASLGAKHYYKDNFVPDAVCLFSGGTDSLTGAVNVLEEGKSVILVSHFESGSDAGVQKHLVQHLVDKYGSSRVRQLSIQVCSAVSVEASTRARSFLFIALGLMTASAYGDAVPVYIPENGFVGINVPLTGSRQGSYSTRTTHPAYVASVGNGLEAASIRHAIINPFSHLSKGEVLKSCKNHGLLRQLLPLTVSCAKAGWIRFAGHSPSANCGFCYPCLVRRAALHALGADDPKGYLYDAIGSPQCLRAESHGRDLRCLLQAVYQHRRSSRSSFFEILKSGSTSAVDKSARLLRPVETGLQEVYGLVSDKGCSDVKRYASL